MLAGTQVVEIHHIHVVAGRACVGNPAAVGREIHAVEATYAVLGDELLVCGRYVEAVEAVLAVAIHDSLAVGA